MNMIVHVSALLHCPVSGAYEYFTGNGLLETWLTAVADVEARPGGRYELFWNPADRQNDSTIGCSVTAAEADRLISFEWRSPRQYGHFANAADPLTHVVVLFIPQGDSTDVHLVHSGWRSTAEWEEARQWQERAWRGAFEALKAKVNRP